MRSFKTAAVKLRLSLVSILALSLSGCIHKAHYLPLLPIAKNDLVAKSVPTGALTSLEGGSVVPLRKNFQTYSSTFKDLPFVTLLSSSALAALASNSQVDSPNPEISRGVVEVEISHENCRVLGIPPREVGRRASSLPSGHFALIDSVVDCETTNIRLLRKPSDALGKSLLSKNLPSSDKDFDANIHFAPATSTLSLQYGSPAFIHASRIDKASPARVSEATEALTAIIARRLDSLPHTDLVWSQPLAEKFKTLDQVANAVAAWDLYGSLYRFDVRAQKQGAIVGHRETQVPSKPFHHREVLDVVTIIATGRFTPQGPDTHLHISDLLTTVEETIVPSAAKDPIDMSKPPIGRVCLAFIYVTPKPMDSLTELEYLRLAKLIPEEKDSFFRQDCMTYAMLPNNDK